MPKYVSTMYILTMDNIQEKLVTCCQAAMTYTAQLRDENEISVFTGTTGKLVVNISPKRRQADI